MGKSSVPFDVRRRQFETVRSNAPSRNEAMTMVYQCMRRSVISSFLKGGITSDRNTVSNWLTYKREWSRVFFHDSAFLFQLKG